MKQRSKTASRRLLSDTPFRNSVHSFREIIQSSPGTGHLGFPSASEAGNPQPLQPPSWEWETVRRILIVRLRSIGDTVLATPSLYALRRFLPQAQIDVVLEDWVAPVLEGSDLVDQVITIPADSTRARARLARQLHSTGYDVVYNLHGGTTATLLTRASSAPHRVGFDHYQYARLHNHLAPKPSTIWQRTGVHSVEQQLALLGWTGVPVSDRPPTKLPVTERAVESVLTRLKSAGLKGFEEDNPIAVIHPSAAFDTKRWGIEKFAVVADGLFARNLTPVVIAGPGEDELLNSIRAKTSNRVITLETLSLPEVTALSSRARIFIGNDSGIAHIAAAAGAPCVVIFGSSNVAHWRPWTTLPSEIVREELPCQPCHGYFCAEFDQPECILRVPVDRVIAAIDRVLRATT